MDELNSKEKETEEARNEAVPAAEEKKEIQ